MTYAADITTPLLILHSESDLRCPVYQAEELFATGDFGASEGAAAQSREAFAGAAAESATAAIALAVKDLAAFTESGVQCPPAQDCIERSRAAGRWRRSAIVSTR